jgi:hypothetical protein
MTRDQIDDLMHEHGIVVVGEAVYALVQLVITIEREECAKVCEILGAEDDSFYAEFSRATNCAAAIRARGDQ